MEYAVNNKPSENSIRQVRRRILQTWTIPQIPIIVGASLPLKTYRYLISEFGLQILAMGISLFLLFRIRCGSPVPLPTLTVRENSVLFAGFVLQMSLLFFDLLNLRLVLISIIVGYFVLRMAFLDLRALLSPSKFLEGKKLNDISAEQDGGGQPATRPETK
jgi:hypothetical protein